MTFFHSEICINTDFRMTLEIKMITYDVQQRVKLI